MAKNIEVSNQELVVLWNAFIKYKKRNDKKDPVTNKEDNIGNPLTQQLTFDLYTLDPNLREVLAYAKDDNGNPIGVA